MIKQADVAEFLHGHSENQLSSESIHAINSELSRADMQRLSDSLGHIATARQAHAPKSFGEGLATAAYCLLAATARPLANLKFPARKPPAPSLPKAWQQTAHIPTQEGPYPPLRGPRRRSRLPPSTRSRHHRLGFLEPAATL